eukprot:TRINITY_DN9779_c0_g1_i1.p1 TRINITY_DN9779_c0_g1~~TRINITY_DN9779_c0_g1_i1.p1  ORF type:complete len:417 (-),score=92.05 TRINITY_DN9779_c0_g1_i1:76-1326(-)
MKVPNDIAMGTIRFSTGKYTTVQDIDKAIDIIVDVVHRLSPKESLDQQEEVCDLDSLGGDISKIKLTHYTQGLGCACKLRPQALEKILSKLPLQSIDPKVLVGPETGDDAAVYLINDETAIVSTLDFFTPIVDSPFHFGAIAAANAMSDVYAMGGKPLFGLNIVGFPSNRLPLEVLNQILAGAQSKASEAGITIIGGHTIDDLEPKYGMAVTGVVHPAKLLRNRGCRPGDVLVLTKPIGTGIITTAIRRGVASEELTSRVIKVMSTLNNKAAEQLSLLPASSVHACTDVTGFGLLGHLKGMIAPTNQKEEVSVDAVITASAVPLLEEARSFCLSDIVPGGTKNNHAFLEKHVKWNESIPLVDQYLLCDAQTSGGLLVSIAADQGDEYVKALRSIGLDEVSIIGKVVQGQGLIHVVP